MLFHPIDINSLYHFIFGMIILSPITVFYFSKRNKYRLFIIAFFLPVLIELTQIFIPERTFDLTDIFMSYLGSGVSILFSLGVPKPKLKI